jgi:adenosylcobinamide-GDP ribazoletransferase
MIGRFLSVLSLMCRLPVPAPREVDYRRADFFIPLIGTLAGAAAWLGSKLGFLILPGSPAAATLGALGVQYLAFNLFHFDGLLDSADALIPMASRERRLAILKDPGIGSYAFACGLFVAAVKFFCLRRAIELSAESLALSWALFSYPVAGRVAVALVPLMSSPARKEGLGSLMVGFSPLASALGWALALVPFAAAAAWAPGARGVAGAAAVYALGALSGSISGLYMSYAYRRKLGGFTGDALGAAVEIGEALFLVLAVAIVARL